MNPTANEFIKLGGEIHVKQTKNGWYYYEFYWGDTLVATRLESNGYTKLKAFEGIVTHYVASGLEAVWMAGKAATEEVR